MEIEGRRYNVSDREEREPQDGDAEATDAALARDETEELVQGELLNEDGETERRAEEET